MPTVETPKNYKSPVRKLMRFFEKSRNQWKAKHHQVKQMLKDLQQQVRALKKRMEQGQQRAEDLEAEVARLCMREQALVEEVERLKREASARASTPVMRSGGTVVPYHHAYSVEQIEVFLMLVFSAAASLRGAAHTLDLLAGRLGWTGSGPSWSTGRLWLLRVGYYKLTRSKVQADDWVWIVDHTVQIGTDKCLVILGVRLCDLPPAGQPLRHVDVEPIALLPVTHSDGAVVNQQLEQATTQTGVPRAIISDHGTDVKAGIELFCDQHPQTSAVYDIKHKTAVLLKHELELDPAWLAFTQQAGHAQSQLRQTALAALVPPSQKTKARYMNVDELVTWGHAILALLDQPARALGAQLDPAQVQQKLGWVNDYRSHLQTWGELFQVVATTESWVRQQGLYRGAARDLQHRLRGVAHTERARHLRDELLAFVTQEAEKARPQERLLGSSEIIESVLGTMKRLEQQQAKSGFTGLILGLCAMVAATTQDVIQMALETVPTKKVWAWCQKVLGPSVQAQRRTALAPG